MNTLKPHSTHLRSPAAFTLIELLVVIGIIALLAGLLFPVTKAVNRVKARAKVRAELAQVQTAIEAYKLKRGHYPPDNPGRPSTNQLYYELIGQPIPSPGIPGVAGVANLTVSGEEDAAKAINFFTALQTRQIGDIGGGVKVLICSIPFRLPDGTQVQNPVRYVSGNPLYNPNSYDLWIDLVIDGKTNRFSNWSRQPQIVYQPGL